MWKVYGAIRILAVCLLTIFVIAGCNLNDLTSSESTAKQDKTEVGFPQGAKWKPTEFVISTLVGIPGGGNEAQNDRSVKYHKEAYFNNIELCDFSNDAMKLALETCQKYDVSAMPFDPVFRDKFASEEDIKERLKFYAPFADTIRGFFIYDEPKYKSDIFEKIKENADWVRKYAPTKLMFINLLPSYGEYTWSSDTGNWQDSKYARYTDDFFKATDPDVLSLDYYIFFSSEVCEADLVVNNLWRDIGYFRMKSIESGKPFWCYIQSLGEFVHNKAIGNMTAERIALQVNSIVAYGAKGVSYYNSLCSLIDQRAYKTVLFEDIKSINQKAMTFGNFLLDKKYDKLYHTSVLSKIEKHYFTDSLEQSELISLLPENVLVSTFKDDSARTYLMVVNRDYTYPMDGDIVLKGKKKVGVLDPESGEQKVISGATDRIQLSLKAGDAALYIIE